MTTKIVLTANNGINGSEPWITDGTPAGTMLLNDVLAGSGSGSVSGSLWGGAVVVGASGTATSGADRGRNCSAAIPTH